MKTQLSIALPWSLSHYIPLHGFHPRYRALFDDCPAYVTLNAWDNVELSSTLRSQTAARLALLDHVQFWERRLKDSNPSPLTQQYHDAFFTPNLAATALLPGEIELHHTAAFPSMTRPFVLLCESAAKVFFPFTSMAQAQAMRAHYEAMFASPLCLGIFSHLPETLAELSGFFNSPVIDQKLFASRIGLSRQAVPQPGAERPAPGMAPRFLFAGQDAEQGCPIVLRAWPAILAHHPGAKLFLRCARPDDALLAARGVDLAFLKAERANSVIWIESSLTQRELNRLLARMHFFLLPSLALDSVSIMQAMAAGVVPIVADCIGTGQFVTHGQTGIILQGDEAAEIPQHVAALLGDPAAYAAVQDRAMARAAVEFSGAAFAGTFWRQLRELVERKNFFFEKKNQKTFVGFPPGDVESSRVKTNKSFLRSFFSKKRPLSFLHCLVPMSDWPRIFESTPQPVTRIHTGIGQVTELGSAFIHGLPASLAPHDVSALAEFCRENSPKLTFAASIADLRGTYLTAAQAARHASRAHRLIERIARLLYPYPPLYRAAARVLRQLRRLRPRPAPAPKPLDIQLVAEDISGLNIIRCADQFFAIPQGEGAFDRSRALANGYSRVIVGQSLGEVKTSILAEAS